jgi:hypothetical protein
MAIVTSGPYVGFSGTVDGFTYSQMADGRTSVKRKNSASKVPLTVSQISVQKDSDIFADFIKPLEDFIRVGYDLEANALKLNHHNAMVKSMRRNTLEGLYPHRYINYSKVLVTKGRLPMPETFNVELAQEGLSFTWSTELIPMRTHHSDQAMMLVYFPELMETVYKIGGAARHTGNDLLNLTGVEKGYTAEVYLSFIADDHTSIANSKYLGQLSW